MTNPVPETPTRTRRWLLPVLIVSIGINLLIAGAVVGAMLSPDGPRSRDNDRVARGVIGEPFLRALPKDDRRALLRDVVRNRERVQESRESLRQRFEAFLTAVRTDPFDSAEVARLLGEQRQVAVRRQEIGEEFLMKRLEAMTPEARAAYADALEEGLKRLRRR